MSSFNRGGFAGVFGSYANALRPAYRVTHIRMTPSTPFGLFVPSFEHIELLRGPNFIKTRQQVVDDILNNRADYYTDEEPWAPRAYLEVQHSGLINPPYVRTRPDCTTRNNLLSLPRF
jgi:hypothetical protein